MTLKSILNEIVPPIIHRIVEKKKNGKLFNSYSDALSFCEDGYKDPQFVKVIIDKNIAFRDKFIGSKPTILEIGALCTVIALSLFPRQDRMNVIDFGGGVTLLYNKGLVW